MSPHPRLPDPPEVDEARRFLRRVRETSALAGGGLTVAALAAYGLGIPFVLPALAVGLGVVAGFALFPPTERGRRAKRIVKRWKAGRTERLAAEAGGAHDPRIPKGEAMVRRIGQLGSEGPDSAGAAARDLLAVLYDALEDRRVIALLEIGSTPTSGQVSLARRAAGLRAEVDRRMDEALEAIVDIYEAVLSRDQDALLAVLGRVDDELRRLQAEAEIGSILEPPRRGRKKGP